MTLQDISYYLYLECKIVLKDGSTYFGRLGHLVKDGKEYITIDDNLCIKLDLVQNITNLKS